MKYEIIEFTDSFELDDDATVVAAQITESGSRPSSHASNRVLARFPNDAEFICGVETDSGECQRTVDGPQQTCWQHSND